jgi:hypothetical protein
LLLGHTKQEKMGAELFDELGESLWTIVDCVVVSESFLVFWDGISQKFEINRFQSVEGQKQNVVRVILLNNLAWISFNKIWAILRTI